MASNEVRRCQELIPNAFARYVHQAYLSLSAEGFQSSGTTDPLACKMQQPYSSTRSNEQNCYVPRYKRQWVSRLAETLKRLAEQINMTGTHGVIRANSDGKTAKEGLTEGQAFSLLAIVFSVQRIGQ